MRKHLLAQILGQAIELSKSFRRAQPSQLALGKLARSGDALLAQCGKGDRILLVPPGYKRTIPKGYQVA